MKRPSFFVPCTELLKLHLGLNFIDVGARSELQKSWPLLKTRLKFNIFNNIYSKFYIHAIKTHLKYNTYRVLYLLIYILVYKTPKYVRLNATLIYHHTLMPMH